jgi:hypothetical protein
VKRAPPIVHYVNWNGEWVGLTMTKLRQVAPLLARELRARLRAGKKIRAAGRRHQKQQLGLDRKIRRTIEREARPAWRRLLARVRRGKA